MPHQFTSTSKLLKILYGPNKQTSSGSSVGFLLLTLEEVNPHQLKNRIDKRCRSLKLTSIDYP